MDDMTLRFTVCWFVDEAYVDVHLIRGDDDAGRQRLGRLIFDSPRRLDAWCALGKILQDHGQPMIDGLTAEIVRGTPDIVNYHAIPTAIMAGLRAHIDKGAPQGAYLTSVLENNLVEAVGRADVHSLAALRDTTTWLWNNAPRDSWGSPERVHQWRQAYRHVEALASGEQRPAEATP